MSALKDQLKETNKLLSALDGQKPMRKRKPVKNSSVQFSRVNKKAPAGNVRALPLVLTRTAVITLLLVCMVIIIGGIEYLNDKDANAVINSEQNVVKTSGPQLPRNLDDEQLLNALSKK